MDAEENEVFPALESAVADWKGLLRQWCERRAALCGMGVCFECRVQIDGVLHERSCMIEVSEGMRVRTVIWRF